MRYRALAGWVIVAGLAAACGNHDAAQGRVEAGGSSGNGATAAGMAGTGGNTGGLGAAGLANTGGSTGGLGAAGSANTGGSTGGLGAGGLANTGGSTGGLGAAGMAGANAGLVADVGRDRQVEAGAHITLDGSRSGGGGSAIVTWSWQQTAGPAVTLVGSDTARSSFDAPTVNELGVTLVFTLTVLDGAGATATASLQVQVNPPSGIVETTSVGKIRRALEEGTLDRDTAVEYLMYAVYGDPRLPAAYAGDPVPSGTWAMDLAMREFPRLSAAAQARVRPFLQRATAPDSWYAAGSSLGLDQGDGLLRAPPVWVTADGAHVRVWYDSAIAGDQLKGEGVRDAIENTIWPALLALWGADHMPLDDSADPSNGGDGRLDVELIHGLSYDGIAAAGLTHPAAPGPTYTLVQLDASLPLDSGSPPGLVEIAAHELTHACQYSYRHHENAQQAPWVFEGIASQAEDYVYPDRNSEHRYAPLLLHSMRLPLDYPGTLREYGTYLFFQYMTRQVSDEQYVRRVFENLETMPALEAIDQAFTDGTTLVDWWGDFVDAAWNHGANGWFRRRDLLEEEAWGEAGAQPAVIPGGSDQALYLDGQVRHLATRYRHFVFDDTRHRWLRFHDGLRFGVDIFTDNSDPERAGDQTVTVEPISEELRRGAVVRVHVLKNGSWSDWYMGDGMLSIASDGRVSACRDAKAEHFDEIVFVFSDGVPDKTHHLAPTLRDPLLWLTNIGCFGWQGQVTASEGDSPNFTVTANSVWQRPDIAHNSVYLLHEAGNWTVSGEVPSSSGETCTASGQGSFSNDYDMTEYYISLSLTSLAGPDYRRFGGWEPGVPMPYTVTCTSSDGTRTYTESGGLTPFAVGLSCDDNNYVPWPLIDAGGTTVAGSFQCATGSVNRQWSFTSFTEP